MEVSSDDREVFETDGREMEIPPLRGRPEDVSAGAARRGSEREKEKERMDEPNGEAGLWNEREASEVGRGGQGTVISLFEAKAVSVSADVVPEV